MPKDRRKPQPFAEVVRGVRAHPAPPQPVPVGRYDTEHWGDNVRRAYGLVNDAVAPGQAQILARAGASVVFDACGCGGAECTLYWLSAADTAALAKQGPPRVTSRAKGDLAILEHWRTDDGHDLVVLGVSIEWGSRIP